MFVLLPRFHTVRENFDNLLCMRAVIKEGEKADSVLWKWSNRKKRVEAENQNLGAHWRLDS